MKTEKINLSRVEGEASLHLSWRDNHIEDAKISIPSIRGIERVLLHRPYMDALVITPRVCGICGHAHLIACAEAIEDALGVEPTEKAKRVRRITQSLEMLQNHIKWFYLFLMPDFLPLEEKLKELYEPFRGIRWRNAVHISSKIAEGIAIFSGQWPHSSYAIPGGVTSEPSYKDLVNLGQILLEVKEFFLRFTVGLEEGKFVDWVSKGDWKLAKGDLGIFLELSEREGLEEAGRSYDRLVSGSSLYGPYGYYHNRLIHGRIRLEHIEELPIGEYSEAKPVRYRGLPFETGPLSRQLLAGNSLIRTMHRNLRDSFLVRVFARVLEIWDLIKGLEIQMEKLKETLDQRSSSLKRPPQRVKGTGYSFVEAARGTLLHSIVIKDGLIHQYSIITPSQWNLGPRCEAYHGVAERALIGLRNNLHAQLVLRSFDVCSVCTTH